MCGLNISSSGTGCEETGNYGVGDSGEVGGFALASYVFDAAGGALRNGLADAGTLWVRVSGLWKGS